MLHGSSNTSSQTKAGSNAAQEQPVCAGSSLPNRPGRRGRGEGSKRMLHNPCLTAQL